MTEPVANTEPTAEQLRKEAILSILDAASGADPVSFQVAVDAQLGERVVSRIGTLHDKLEQTIFAGALEGS